MAVLLLYFEFLLQNLSLKSLVNILVQFEFFEGIEKVNISQ